MKADIICDCTASLDRGNLISGTSNWAAGARRIFLKRQIRSPEICPNGNSYKSN